MYFYFTVRTKTLVYQPIYRLTQFLYSDWDMYTTTWQFLKCEERPREDSAALQDIPAKIGCLAVVHDFSSSHRCVVWLTHPVLLTLPLLKWPVTRRGSFFVVPRFSSTRFGSSFKPKLSSSVGERSSPVRQVPWFEHYALEPEPQGLFFPLTGRLHKY